MDIDHRIGFEERDEAVQRLQEHMAAGRLELDEFEERTEKALSARTIADLIDLFHDLPDEDWMVQETANADRRAVAPTSSADLERKEYRTGGGASALATAVAVGMFVSGLVLLGVTQQALSLAAFVFIPVVLGIGRGLVPTRGVEFERGNLESELRALIAADMKIMAIKRLREEKPGLGLLDAKNQVEAIEWGMDGRQPGR